MKIWFDTPGRDGDEKIVLVGQAPSRDTVGQPPFSGRSGKRIAMLMGIEHDELAKRFALAYKPARSPPCLRACPWQGCARSLEPGGVSCGQRGQSRTEQQYARWPVTR